MWWTLLLLAQAPADVRRFELVGGLTVQLSVPKDWTTKKIFDDEVMVVASGTKMKIAVTCHGGCDAKDLPGNIREHARYQFDFIASFWHFPHGKAEWLVKPRRTDGNRFVYRFLERDLLGGARAVHVGVQRILPGPGDGGRVLSCDGTVDLSPPEGADLVEEVCRRMEVSRR